MNIDVLLAEDDDSIAGLIVFKLTREGFRVTRARDGREAISLATGGASWGLVILDVMMPLADGWEVLGRVRSEPSLQSLPILMLTAKGDRQTLENASRLGATDFLKKPFDPAELARMVKRMAEKS